MNPNIPQEIQNAINEAKITSTNIIPQNSSSIKRISIIKTEEQKQLIQPKFNTNNNIDNNSKSKIIKETKTTTTTYSTSGATQNLLFNNNNNNIKLAPMSDNSYKVLVKKIANQLKKRVRPPTMGFFNFAFQKGEYSLLIIRKIAPQIKNHQIELNNEVFRIYIQKYKKYKELIKRIAHLLKLSIKKTNVVNNMSNAHVTTVTNTTIGINEVIVDNDNKINNNVIKIGNKKEQIIKADNNNNMIQKKTKTQTQTHKFIIKTNRNSKYNNNVNKHRYSTNNNISHTKINPVNPFLATQEKMSFNSKSFNNLQNQNQFFMHNKDNNIMANNNINLINNNNNNRIFNETPINSKFAEISGDVEMKNNIIENKDNNNILIDNKQTTTLITTSLVNSGMPNNNQNQMIESNNANNNEINLSMVNNYNSDSRNNLSLSSINKEEEKAFSLSNESKKSSKKKTIHIKLSPFKKDIKQSSIEEEKTINSNIESQNIDLDNIQKINCNTFLIQNSQNHNTDNNNNLNNKDDSIIFQKEISTSADEVSYLKKFDNFLSKNNIIIQSFIPMAVSEQGQQYLKQNVFWEKYINYIYLNHIVNNIRLSLFSFVHIIEQYFLWCENANPEIVKEFKKKVIDILNKIYKNEDIKQFCSMNKINNLEELFEKYKIFMYNNNKNDNYK